MKRYILMVIIVLGMLMTVTACGKENTNNNQIADNQGNEQDTNKVTNGETQNGEAQNNETKELTLGQYKNVEVKLLNLSYTEDDVTGMMYNSLVNLAQETDRTKVQRYDLLDIDFSGKMDGKEFEGGTANGYALLIGSNSFIEGFEEGLIGVGLNETVDLNLKFPENYGSTELQGKDVVFTVTVNQIKEMPEVTDALIEENTDYKTRTEYCDLIRKNMQSTMESNIESQMQSDLMATIIANTTFHKDLTAEISSYSSNLYSSYEYMASMYQVSMEEFISGSFGITLEAFQEQLPEVAELAVKRGYVLMAIAEEEKMQVSDEEYNEYTDEMMAQYGYTTREELEAATTKENMLNTILYKKAMDFVIANAVKVN